MVRKEGTMNDYTIIGADAAGLSAAVQIGRIHSGSLIRIINKGSTISYGACGIPFVIGRDISDPANLIHFTPESLETTRGLKVDVKKEVVDIDPARREIQVKDLGNGEIKNEGFRKLLIATGAVPRRLPFLDYEQEGVFNVHTIPDLEKIETFIKNIKPQRAGVIGAGFIGLELCEALTKRGVEVVLLEALDAPIAPWPESAKSAIVKKLKERRLNFFPKTFVREVQTKEGVFHLQTDDKTFECDMIFSVVGTSPATVFCGRHFDTLKNGALQIDASCRTSIADIFAAGDCASVNHLVLDRPVYMPLGSTANKLGRIAGMNMAGNNILFPGIVGTQIFKFFDLSLAKTGLSREEAEQEGREAVTYSATRLDRAGYYPGAEKVKMELTFDKASQQLVGALVICRGNAAQHIDPAVVAVTGKMQISDLAWLDAAYSPPFAPVWNVLVSAAFKGFRPTKGS